LPQMLPAIPPPTIRPITPPTVAPLNQTVGLGSNRVPTVRAQPLSSRDTAVRENDQLLDHGVTSICRGC
jgi:hypothetical protein